MESVLRTVLKPACDNVAFPPQSAGLGFGELGPGCLWGFSFQWPSRHDEEEAESDLDFVIDLLVNPGEFTAVFRVFLCTLEHLPSSQGY